MEAWKAPDSQRLARLDGCQLPENPTTQQAVKKVATRISCTNLQTGEKHLASMVQSGFGRLTPPRAHSYGVCRQQARTTQALGPLHQSGKCEKSILNSDDGEVRRCSATLAGLLHSTTRPRESALASSVSWQVIFFETQIMLRSWLPGKLSAWWLVATATTGTCKGLARKIARWGRGTPPDGASGSSFCSLLPWPTSRCKPDQRSQGIAIGDESNKTDRAALAPPYPQKLK